MMGVAGILGGALLSAIHGATIVNTLYQDGGAYTTFRALSLHILCTSRWYVVLITWYYWISI